MQKMMRLAEFHTEAFRKKETTSLSFTSALLVVAPAPTLLLGVDVFCVKLLFFARSPTPPHIVPSASREKARDTPQCPLSPSPWT